MGIISILLILGLIIAVHEFGHLVVAKKCGVKVEVYSIGFGPKLLSKKIGNTNYCISAIPLGGYAKMVGMPGEESERTSAKNSFASKSPWQRFCILFAGPASNILLCVFILMLSNGIYGVHRPSEDAIIGNTIENYPAHKAGMLKGDRIVNIDGNPIESWLDIMNTLRSLPPDQDVIIIVERNGQKIPLSIIPVNNNGIMQIGIASELNTERGLLLSISESIKMTYSFTADTFMGLYGMISGELEIRDSLAGPIQIVTIGNDLQRGLGLEGLLFFAAIISLSIAILNLLPVPALDGGHIFLIGIEVIRGKPISPKNHLRITQFGIFLLLFLMLYVILNDIDKVFFQ